MSMKRSLLAAVVSTGAMLALTGWMASALAVTDYILVCDNDGQPVPAHSSALVHCETPNIPLSAFKSIDIRHVAPDVSASNIGVTIQSIETTLNMLDSGGNQVDFIDFAFSPYANVDAGGANATFGATQSPKLDLDKSTIQNDPISIKFSTPITQIQFQLQAFVNNTTGSVQTASESLRILADY